MLTVLWNTVTPLSKLMFRFHYWGYLFHKRFLDFILSRGMIIKLNFIDRQTSDSINEANGRLHQFCFFIKYRYPNYVEPIKCIVKFKVLLITYTSFMIPIIVFTRTISWANYLLRELMRKVHSWMERNEDLIIKERMPFCLHDISWIIFLMLVG